MTETPHGHCYVCGGLLPPDRQDQGGKQCCSRLCEHVVRSTGSYGSSIYDACIVCGKDISGREHGRFVACGDECGARIAHIRSLYRYRQKHPDAKPIKRHDPHKARKRLPQAPSTSVVGRDKSCIVCDNPTSGAKYCSNECRLYGSKDLCRESIKIKRKIIASDLDDYLPTEEELSTMYDNCFKFGIFDSTFEVNYVIRCDSLKTGVAHHQFRIQMDTDGPDPLFPHPDPYSDCP